MRLLIGNMNYSSWSMRPWLLLTQLQIPFEEVTLSFNDPDFETRVLAVSPVGKVPVLVDDDIVIWDSLAITEYWMTTALGEHDYVAMDEPYCDRRDEIAGRR
jgi:glutathione S-transferase